MMNKNKDVVTKIMRGWGAGMERSGEGRAAYGAPKHWVLDYSYLEIYIYTHTFKYLVRALILKDR